MIASRMTSLRRRRDQPATVSPVELFFDLVYAVAIGQLSHHLLEHLDGVGVAQTAVLLLAVMSAWSHTVWVVSMLDIERLPVRGMLLAVMFCSVFLTTSIPGAFEYRGWLFVSCGGAAHPHCGSGVPWPIRPLVCCCGAAPSPSRLSLPMPVTPCRAGVVPGPATTRWPASTSSSGSGCSS
ncbi:MAG: low temperature requirement protein A [Euzebyaceae bacterium]|nr:low temperature requirement protein A [Euzebyaceae bacterium]